jgi:thiosulfate dehydrogenase [quinone] large subunit
MSKNQRISIFVLRIALGWFFLYAGWQHLTDPHFSALGYLENAKILTGFYTWLASSHILPFVNFINAWGLTLLGLSLILGFLVRVSASLGVLLMILYWLPLGIIYPDTHTLFVDDHIIYSIVLILLITQKAGSFYSLGSYLVRISNWPKNNWFVKLIA